MSQEHTEQTTGEAGVPPEEILAAAKVAEQQVITRMLGANPRFSREIGDITQQTILAAWWGVEQGKFDPEKAPLTAWVKSIAKHKTLDHLRRAQRPGAWQAEGLMSDTPEKTATRQMEEAKHRELRGTETDHAELYAEVEADRVWLKPILMVTVQTLDERKFFIAYLVHFKFDGSVSLAAEHLADTEEQIRKAVRMFRLHMQVISNALKAQRAGARGTIRDLIDCLPGDGEAGSHMRRIAEAIEAWTHQGHPISTVTREFICEHTGFRHNTVRQRIKTVLTLLRVANTVITRVPVDETVAERG